jgi:hypothetical protein
MFETMKVSFISDPVIDEADLHHIELHLLSLRRSQLDLDPHYLPLYVAATTKHIDELELIIVIVYPETRNRSLESIEALFSTPSPFYWKMEQAYKLYGDVLVEHEVNKSDGLYASQNELTSYEKPEAQTIA